MSIVYRYVVDSMTVNTHLPCSLLFRHKYETRGSIVPYLFVLCMEILSGLFCKMSANQEFKFHWRCKKDKISHLCFADDLMIFSNGDVNSIRMIRSVLTKFQDLSGLYPNPNKSDIFLSGVLNAEREQIIYILGFREGELPMKYLGVPLL